MSNTVRLVGMVVILLVVALTAALLSPEWAHDLGLEQHTSSTLMRKLRGAWILPGSFESTEHLFQQRLLEKQRVTEAVIAGRLSLFEAAVVFRRLNNEKPTLIYFSCYLDRSEEERLCLQVLSWVRTQMEQRHSDVVEEVVARLEEELRQHKERHGKVILPEVAAAEN